MSETIQAIETLPMKQVDKPPGAGTDNLPYVTHEGVWEFGGKSIRVYQLSSGERVLDADDVHAFFGADLPHLFSAKPNR